MRVWGERAGKGSSSSSSCEELCRQCLGLRIFPARSRVPQPLWAEGGALGRLHVRDFPTKGFLCPSRRAFLQASASDLHAQVMEAHGALGEGQGGATHKTLSPGWHPTSVCICSPEGLTELGCLQSGGCSQLLSLSRHLLLAFLTDTGHPQGSRGSHQRTSHHQGLSPHLLGFQPDGPMGLQPGSRSRLLPAGARAGGGGGLPLSSPLLPSSHNGKC